MDTPPRLATLLLRCVLPEDVRDAIDGDLHEVYARRRAQSGVARAQLWYWSTTLSFVARFAVERLRETVDHLVGRERVPSSLDFKLGGRMLRKHPGLALVGGLGMAVATAIGVGSFAFFNTYMYPDLPLHEGDRIVSIISWDTEHRTDKARVLHDFVAWRAEAKSLVDIGAFRTSRRNLIDSSGQGSAVTVAEMSAAGFRVAQVQPLRGRVFADADERPQASPVIVIGEDVWSERFHSDPNIIGRVVRLGRVAHVVIGVMPKGFAFPVNHSYWIPLHADPAAYAIGDGPELEVFARLAPGVTRGQAQAELAVIGTRMATAHPETHARLTPRIMDYPEVFANADANGWTVVLIETVLALLLVLVCLNVAVLVYARTVVRTGEIAVRTALGATRGRIVTQLFAEALVLSLLSASAGLALVAFGLHFLDDVLEASSGGLPFWVNPGLSAGTVLYTLALAFLGAVVVGVLPAMRATRGQVGAILSTLSGGSKPQLGRTWTWMIVAQVAVAVGILPAAMLMGRHWVSQAMTKPGFPSDEYLSAGLVLERDGDAFSKADLATPTFRSAMRATQSALLEGLESDPLVAGVTFGADIPGYHPYTLLAVDGIPVVLSTRHARVAPNYLKAFGVKLVAGRAFTDADVAHETARPIIVNRTFVERTRIRGSVVGRRVRFPLWSTGGWADTTALEWREIVGVVEDFPAGRIGIDDPGDTKATLYDPIALGERQDVTVFVHTRTRPTTFAPRLRALATAADPTLQLRDVQSMEHAYALGRRSMTMAALALVLVVGSVLLLSAAGMYAMMSFSVSQRRREIGVRSALGAGARQILVAVLARAALQLGAGVAAGLVLVVVVDRLVSGGELLGRTGLITIPATALFMVAIGLIAAAGPARYGLRIQPTEALRSE